MASSSPPQYPPGEVRCGGELCEVSEFLHTLRVRLWAEHLGLLDAEELSGARVTHQAAASAFMGHSYAHVQGWLPAREAPAMAGMRVVGCNWRPSRRAGAAGTGEDPPAPGCI